MTSDSAPVEPGLAVAVEWADWGTLEVTGPDRLRWLDAIVTCDVGGLVSGRGVWGLLLTRQGKIQTDTTIVAAPDRALVAVAPDTASTVCAVLDRMLIMEDAEIADVSAGHSWISVHGPRGSDAVLAAAARLPGATAAAVDWLGIGGGALVVPAAAASEAMVALAAVHPGLVVADRARFDRLRLEHAWPLFGTDYGPEENPHQAGLDHRAVSWTKGCYLGQEVVCMADLRGKVRRRLGLMVMEGSEAPAVGASVHLEDGGPAIGEVTSSAPGDGREALALARVLRTAVDAKARVTAGGLRGRLFEGRQGLRAAESDDPSSA